VGLFTNFVLLALANESMYEKSLEDRSCINFVRNMARKFLLSNKKCRRGLACWYMTLIVLCFSNNCQMMPLQTDTQQTIRVHAALTVTC